MLAPSTGKRPIEPKNQEKNFPRRESIFSLHARPGSHARPCCFLSGFGCPLYLSLASHAIPSPVSKVRSPKQYRFESSSPVFPVHVPWPAPGQQLVVLLLLLLLWSACASLNHSHCGTGIFGWPKSTLVPTRCYSSSVFSQSSAEPMTLSKAFHPDGSPDSWGFVLFLQ